MKINNLYQILHLLEFKSSDDFYFLQIIKRRKENPNLKSNAKVVKSYYITSKEHLESKFEEIKGICNLTNARAYINPTSRSFEKIAFHALKKVTDCIMNKDFKSINNSYDSVCGEYASGNKLWVVDVDTDDFNEVLTIAEEINRCDELSTQHNPAIVSYIQTINGWHIICKPFNIKLIEPFRVSHQFDLHKNSPTLLYYNKHE